METQTPATLPSSDKKEILVVKFQCVEDRAPQFRVPPKVRELTPSFLLFEGQQQDNRALSAVGGKQPPSHTALDTQVTEHLNIMKWLQDAAVSVSDFPNTEFHQNKSMITTLLSFETFSQTDH